MPARRHGFTLVELLVVIAIIGVLIALLLPAVQAAREASRRTQCMSNLKQIGLAVQTYHDSHGHFPTGRNTRSPLGVSWAFNILPQIEEQSVYDAYVPTERVDSPLNAAAMRTPIEVYACPSRRPAAADRDFDNDDQPSLVRGAATLGDYAANAGLEEDIGMEGNDFIDGQIDLTLAGPIFSGSKISARRVVDGLSKTIAVGEKYLPPVQDDWEEGRVHALQGDSCFLASANLETIMRGAEGGIQTDDSDRRAQDFGSEHSGVTLFVFLDGHAEALSESQSHPVQGLNPNQVGDIDVEPQWEWFAALCTVAGEEVVGE
ncbi:MAG: DUF1559 domain-containing protein [Planctomycetales bacterium]|nr:DUF1559 domain-containing protein [Planctomycetales bacterium]